MLRDSQREVLAGLAQGSLQSREQLRSAVGREVEQRELDELGELGLVTWTPYDLAETSDQPRRGPVTVRYYSLTEAGRAALADSGS